MRCGSFSPFQVQWLCSGCAGGVTTSAVAVFRLCRRGHDRCSGRVQAVQERLRQVQWLRSGSAGEVTTSAALCRDNTTAGARCRPPACMRVACNMSSAVAGQFYILVYDKEKCN